MSNDWQQNQGGFGQPANPYSQGSAGQFGQPAFDQQPSQTPRRGWFGRNWWWFIPGLIFLPIIGCGGCCVGAIALYFQAVQEPYELALEQVRQSQDVQDALGTPIEGTSWAPVGDFNVENDRGEATLMFNVEGPDGSAQVSFSARMVAGQWGLTELIVTVNETGERIVIDTTGDEGDADAPIDDGGGEAPVWNPEPQAAADPPSRQLVADPQ